jgi:hypothetical protein
MARYYLLTGYLIKASHKGNNISLPSMPRKSAEKIYRKQGIPVPPKPKNYSLLKISSNLEIKVVYTDLNYGHLLIRASSRREAYSIAFAIIGYFGNFVGWPSEYVRLGYFLPEFNRMPNPSWTRSDLLRALREVDYRANELSIPELTTGTHVDEQVLQYMASFVKCIYRDPDLLEALNHLTESRYHFFGFMTGSYYHFHYSRERPSMPKWEQEKRYLENRYRYETAFITCFKGIERFFRVNDFKKGEIPSLFKNINYQDVSLDTEYVRYHEIFSGKPKKISYGELLKRFLIIRNVAAAHGNRTPPKDFMVTEDNIFEIQLFLQELISNAVNSLMTKNES